MKEIIITEPSFVSSFSCTGGACRDHCCKGWTISLDKQTVKKYTSSKNIQIKTIASENIDLIKRDGINWGVIKFNQSTGNCPYLDGDSLCLVQKNLGAQALSHTCSTFPRVKRIYRNEVQKSLNLSCPEVASILLNDPNAMSLEQRVKIQDGFNPQPAISQQKKLLNLFCLSLIDHADAHVEVGLFAVIKFLLYIENREINDETLGEIESVYAALIEQIQSATLQGELAAFDTDSRIKTSLILRIQDYFRRSVTSRGTGVLNYYIDHMLKALVADHEETLESRLMIIEREGTEIFRRDLQDKVFAFKNFLLYKFWQNDFPNQTDRSPLQSLYLIIAEYYFIKLLTLSYAKVRGSIECDDIVNIVYSFHSISQHNKNVSQEFYNHIESVRLGDDISMIHLLT